MIIKPWAAMPTRWIIEGNMAQNIGWSRSKELHGSAAIAALMIWIVLVSQAEQIEENSEFRSVDLTYEGLIRATGLSRKLIANGVDGLKGLNLIEVELVRRFNRYHIGGYTHGDWAKLATRALYKGDEIKPFYSFHKRAVCELHALMMFLYYVAVRSNKIPYSMASFEKICERTGVPEKKIPAANAFLINSGLILNIDKNSTGDSKFKEPNKYYLAGYRDLFVGMKR